MKIFAAIADAGTVKMFYEKTGLTLNYLISYFYLDGQAYKLTKEYKNMIDTLFLDSGAYSAETRNVVIRKSEYRKYLKLYGDHFDEYFNLDDNFDDPDHNLSNQEFIEQDLPSGAKRPIPVVHSNENPFGEFRMYAQLGYTFIAIGSTTKISDEVFKRIKAEYPKIRIHMFGRLDIDELKKYKPYSADAATWAHAAANGNILYWNPDEEEKYIISVGSRDRNDSVPHFKSFKHRNKVEVFLRETFDYGYSDLLKKGGAERGDENRMIVNLFCFKEMQNYLTALETQQKTPSKK
jgi:hypothetical protein